jgi:Xaa-Pro aminopeptidase
MNFDQADRVLAELELDALVLGSGVNFRHATGFRPVLTRMGRPPGSLAVVTRQKRGPVAVVMAEFSYYYTLADVHRAQGLPIYLYSASRWPAEEDESGDAIPLDLFPDRGEVPLDRIETDRLRFTEAEVRGQKPAGSQVAALAQVLTAFDLLDGRIAVDGPAVAAALGQAAPKAVQADADDALRRIRLVKSPVEITLMRQAAQGNVDAALEAIGKVRAGGSYRGLRSEFFAAAARRGQRGVFMVVDRVSDESFDAELRDGQAFLIDCVSEYEGYHGDYGRTVFIGEPPAAMRKVTTAIGQAWDRVRDELKPGMRFSDIRATGQAALADAGVNYRVPFNPHSVGLYHTDHTGFGTSPPIGDVLLEPGMILSIDCPLIESGVGGSAHLEDLVLITDDGSEAINDTSQQVIQL